MPSLIDWLVGFIKFLILGQTKEVVENVGLRRGLFQYIGHGLYILRNVWSRLAPVVNTFSTENSRNCSYW